MDAEIKDLCDALDALRGIHVLNAYCGYGRTPVRIFFTAKDIEALPAAVRWFTLYGPCGGWSVHVQTSISQAVTFLIEGPQGEEGYKDSRRIAKLMRDCLKRGGV